MIADTIRNRLQAAFAPEIIELADESHKHIGHTGNRGGGHYRLLIVSPLFAGMNRIARQRAVQEQLQDLYAADIHALSIRAQTPEEYRA